MRVRIDITLRRRTLRRIDEAARRLRMSRSGFVDHAITALLGTESESAVELELVAQRLTFEVMASIARAPLMKKRVRLKEGVCIGK